MIDNLFEEIKDKDEKTQFCILTSGDNYIRQKESKTSRVTYCKKDHSFCFWFLPDLENTTTFYEIKMDLEKHPAEVMLNAMYKLSVKKWYNIDVQQDFLELFRYVIGETQWSKISSMS